MKYSYTYDTKVELKVLEIRKDKKNFIVEDQATGDFYEMPEVCIEAIKMVEANVDLRKLEELLKVKYPSEEIDILDFIEQLGEFNLIKSIDGQSIHTKVADKDTKEKQPALKKTQQMAGKFFFNRFTLMLFPLILLLNVLIFLIRPSLFPGYLDLFIFDVLMANILAWMVISLFLVLFHELGHILAMRAYGMPAKISLGHCLFLVVLETDLSGGLRLPASKRNVLYLAGIYFDSLILFIALSLKSLPLAPVVNGILGIIIFDIVIKLIYQCCIYMKTDLYYVLENITGCYNLQENGKKLLVKWIPFVNINSEEVSYREEERFIRYYAVLYTTGLVITLSILIYYYIPQLLYAFNMILPGFKSAPDTIPFWDAVLFTFQIALSISLLLYSWSKKYIHKH